MQVTWVATSPCGQVRSRTSADENTEHVLNTLQSFQSLLLSNRAILFCTLSQSGLQRQMGDKEAFSRALSWLQWAFCHFSDSRTGPQC